MIWIVISYALLLGYIFLIAFYNRYWLATPVFEVRDDVPSTLLTIIIPARNEALRIEKCLHSLLAQDYPSSLLEIIVVDDHSKDDTAAIVRRYESKGVKLLSMQETSGLLSQNKAYKKMALTAGVQAAKGDLVITTDADCDSGSNWIRCIESFYKQTGSVFIAGPVRMKPGKSFLSIFQSIDFAILQGITAASLQARFHPMCNGANMAYERKVFFEVGGYEDDKLVSGDDMLLLHKIADRYPDRIAFLKSPKAMVNTQPAQDWGSFFSQRIRWASKTGRYGDAALTWVWAGVYALNLFFVITFAYACVQPFYFSYFLLLLLLKTAIEWKFTRTILRFYELDDLMKWFLPAQPIHIIYIVITGLLSRGSGYTWKDRRVK